MDISAVDRSAIAGDSWLHRASAPAKLAAMGFVLVAVVASYNFLVLVAVAGLMAAAVLSARLPARLAFGLAAYPALFAAVFAVASSPSVPATAVIVLKAVTAALSAVTLVLTTPYPVVFSYVQRIVPPVVGDALLMTYRTFFLLAERFTHLVRAIRLRTVVGRRTMLRTATATGSALGNLVLYAFDLAERDYEVMHVRGYSGRLRALPQRGRSAHADIAVLTCSLLVASMAVTWRLQWRTLNPYSWLPVLVSAFAIGFVLLRRWVRELHAATAE